jgi:F-type H+-transporting ATPase subunit a
MFNLFSESGPVVHIAPGGVLVIHGITVTNSMLYGWICLFFISIFLIFIARKVTIHPKKGIYQLIELGVDFIGNLVRGAFEDKKKAEKYVPIFATFFLIILLNNWLGLLPFVGEGIQSNSYPLFRPFTADLNATLAIGLCAMAIVYVGSIIDSGGIKKYLNHFFVGSPKNPLFFVIGLLEMFTDATRVLSLSLRLFLNVTIGEIVIAVFSYLGHLLAPISALPFTLIELFIGALQAYIFTILATMYLAIAVNHASEHVEEHS